MSSDCDKCGLDDVDCKCYLQYLEKRIDELEKVLLRLTLYRPKGMIFRECALYENLFEKKLTHIVEEKDIIETVNWISVDDMLPEEGVRVLTYLQEDDAYKINYIVECDTPIWACILEREEYKVTHWMPLPKKPE